MSKNIVVQDVTFTVDINEITPARYSWLMKLVEDIGTGDVNTFTYVAGEPDKKLTDAQSKMVMDKMLA